MVFHHHTAGHWSAKVTKESHALDLEPEVFKAKNARAIAKSLKRSAEQSHQRAAKPFRSAMSMLTFYINRAGQTLSAKRKRTLEKAKDELRALYGKTPKTAPPPPSQISN